MSFLGPVNLAPGGHVLTVATTSSATKWPFTGQGDFSLTLAASHILSDTLVQLVGVLLYQSSAPNSILIRNKDDTSTILRISIPTWSTGQLWMPFGRAGIIVPNGFSTKATANGAFYAVMYRRLADERIL